MADWMFNFWQMLAISFVCYQVGSIVGEIKGLKRANDGNIEPQSLLKIDIEWTNEQFYAYEEETRTFITQADTYDELGQKLNVLRPNILCIIDKEKLNRILTESKTIA